MFHDLVQNAAEVHLGQIRTPFLASVSILFRVSRMLNGGGTKQKKPLDQSPKVPGHNLFEKMFSL